MLTPQQERNLRVIAEASTACEKRTQFPREISTTQAIFESAYLTRETGWNNVFGIKANGHGSGSKLVLTHEFIGGEMRVVECFFESYNSLADCFADHARLLISGIPYQNAWQSFLRSGDLDQFVRDFGPIYATAPGYAETIIAEMHSAHVTQALADTDRTVVLA